MGEGGALSFFRFHLSPFPQKRLILRLGYNPLDTLKQRPHHFRLVCVAQCAYKQGGLELNKRNETKPLKQNETKQKPNETKKVN